MSGASEMLVESVMSISTIPTMRDASVKPASKHRPEVAASVRDRITQLTGGGSPIPPPAPARQNLSESCVEVVDTSSGKPRHTDASGHRQVHGGRLQGRLANMIGLAGSRLHFDQRTRGMLALIMVAVAVVAAAVAWFAWPKPEAVPAAMPVAHTDDSATKSDTDAHLKVSVVGDVAEPGLVEVPSGGRVADAVDAAGGLADDAESAGYLNLARKINDGELIVVDSESASDGAAASDSADDTTADADSTDSDSKSQADTDDAGKSTADDADSSSDGDAAAADSAPVNINEATADELTALPGVGPVTAKNVVEYREQNGGFDSADQLQEVDGIGPATFKKLSSMVTV